MSADDKEPYFDGPHKSTEETLCNASEISYDSHPEFNTNGPHSSNQFLNPSSGPPVVSGVVMYSGEFPSHPNQNEESYQFKSYPPEAGCGRSHQEEIPPANHFDLNAASNSAAFVSAPPNHVSFIPPVGSGSFSPQPIFTPPTSSHPQLYDPAQATEIMSEPTAPMANTNEVHPNNQPFGSYMNIANNGDQLYTSPSNDVGGSAMMPFQPAPSSVYQEDSPNLPVEGTGALAPSPHMEFRVDSIHPAPGQFQRNFLPNETRPDAEDSLHSQGTWPSSGFAVTSAPVHLPPHLLRDPPEINQIPGGDIPHFIPDQVEGGELELQSDEIIAHGMADLNIEADYDNAVTSSDDETDDDEVCNDFNENIMVIEGGDNEVPTEIHPVDCSLDPPPQEQSDDPPATHPPTTYPPPSASIAPPLPHQPANSGSESLLIASTNDLSCPHTAAHALHVLPVESPASSSPSHTATNSSQPEEPDQQSQLDVTSKAFLDEHPTPAHAHEPAEAQEPDPTGLASNVAPYSDKPPPESSAGVSFHHSADVHPPSSAYIAPCTDEANNNAILDTHTMHSSYVSMQSHQDPTSAVGPAPSAANISVPLSALPSGNAALPLQKEQLPHHPLRSQMMAPETSRLAAASSNPEPHPVVPPQQPDTGKERQDFNTMHANLPVNQATPPLQPNQSQRIPSSEAPPSVSTNEDAASSNCTDQVLQSKENYLNPTTNNPVPSSSHVAPIHPQSQALHNSLQPATSNDKPQIQVPYDSRPTQALNDPFQPQAPHDLSKIQGPYDPRQAQAPHNPRQIQNSYDPSQNRRPNQPNYDPRQTQPPYNDGKPRGNPPPQVPNNPPHEPQTSSYYQPHAAERGAPQDAPPQSSHDNTQPPYQQQPSAQYQWDRRYDDSRQGYQHDRYNPRYTQRWPDQRQYDGYYRDYDYGYSQRRYGPEYEGYRPHDYYYAKGHYGKQNARYDAYDRYSGKYSGGHYDDWSQRDYYGRHNRTYAGHQHRYHDDDDDRRSTYSEHSMHGGYQQYPGNDHYNRSHDMHQPQQNAKDATFNESYYPNPYQDDTWQELPKVPPARRTPAKFTTCHPVARFGAGGHLIMVVPRQSVEAQSSSVEIHNVETLLHKTKEAEYLKVFPGPLSRDETHKNDVVRFITSQSRNCAVNTDLIDRQSAALVWDFLGLLVRQNGSVLGTDIAELIMKDHTGDFTLLASPNEENTEASARADVGGGQEDSERITSEHDASEYAHGRESHVCPSVRFRELLLYGRKKDALEWAMKSNLWGHALLLASKTDTRTHATVMLRFANSLPINDPLQTLYQLMSGRQPASATCVADEGWGDWRPHLSMILSNSTSSISLDTRVVMTMGDTMMTRGLINAAHFCYLMASNPLGYYTKKSSKLVLLGSSHMRPFKEFATNDAIQRSETYEYAISLAAATPQSSRGPVHLSSLQLYKFVYACRLLDYGMVAKAFHYCENIAKVIIQSPTAYSVALVSKLSDMVECLKHHDSRVQAGTLHDSDLQWAQALKAISGKMLGGSIIPSTLSYTTQSPSELTSSAAVTPHPHDDEESDESDDEYQEEHDGYDKPDYASSWQHQQGQHPPNEAAPPQQALYAPPGNPMAMQEANPSSSTAPPAFVPMLQVDTNLSQATMPPMPGFYNPVSQPHQPSQHHQQPSQHHQQLSNNQQQPSSQQDDLSPTLSSSSQTFSSLPPRHHPPNSGPPDLYDHLSSLPRDMKPGARDRTVSQTSHGSRRSRRSRKSSGRRTRTTSEHSKRSRSRSTSAESEKKVEKTSKKGWSIINWFKGSDKPKQNRVHLPDDSNKDIIWDDKLKRWVDVNATEEELAPPAPPPKDTPASNPVSAPFQPGQDATGQSTLTSNRFSLKNLNNRSMYKNAFSSTTNPSTNNVIPQPMISTLPQSTAPAMFVPTLDPNLSTPRNEPTVGQDTVQPPAPTQHNPAQSGLGGQPAQTQVDQPASFAHPQASYQPSQMQQQFAPPQQYQHPSQLSQQQVVHPDPPLHQHGSLPAHQHEPQPASTPHGSQPASTHGSQPAYQHGLQPVSTPHESQPASTHLQDNQPTAAPPPAEPVPMSAPPATFYNPAQFSGGPNLFSQPPVPQGGAIRSRGRGRYPTNALKQ